MWLLDLRLKSLNKIYFYYTDPTSVLPYGNIRCSIENRTKHGGTGVQMPLEQNQNIRCRKNCDTNFKWSKSWAKKGNGFFQLLWSGYLCVEHQEIGISREVSLTGESGLIWHIFFFMIQFSHRESFDGFLTSPGHRTCELISLTEEPMESDGKDDQDWDGAWLDRISQWTERSLSICVTIACKRQSGMEKSGVYIRDGPT